MITVNLIRLRSHIYLNSAQTTTTTTTTKHKRPLTIHSKSNPTHNPIYKKINPNHKHNNVHNGYLSLSLYTFHIRHTGKVNPGSGASARKHRSHRSGNVCVWQSQRTPRSSKKWMSPRPDSTNKMYIEKCIYIYTKLMVCLNKIKDKSSQMYLYILIF